MVPQFDVALKIKLCFLVWFLFSEIYNRLLLGGIFNTCTSLIYSPMLLYPSFLLNGMDMFECLSHLVSKGNFLKQEVASQVFLMPSRSWATLK